MKVLALDISSSAGWSFFKDGQLSSFGHKELPHTIHQYGDYPWSYIKAARDMANMLLVLVQDNMPDVVVIEETNLGKNRYSQKFLEFTHALFLLQVEIWVGKVIYISSSAWRKALGLEMSKEDKKRNAKLSKAKKTAAATGEKLDKKTLGIVGKVTKKHLAVRYANSTFTLNLKMKDNDIADAICLGAAYLKGAPAADGVM